MNRSIKILTLLTLMASTPFLWADVPKLINFSGRLLQGGVPVTTPSSVTFRLFGQAGGGSVLFSETQSVTPDADGIYSALIGQTSPLDVLAFNSDLYIEVEVEGETLTPRYRMVSSPFAIRASSANSVEWTGVQNVPAGFSDGIDDVGSTPGVASIGSFHIIDSTVSLSDMAPDSVDSSKVVDDTLVNADLSPTAAIALSKLEKDPSVSGTINLATNPVDWSRLKSVPVGFSDGIDDVGTIGASSIGSFHIIDSTVSLMDLAPNSVDFTKVVDGSLWNAEIAPTAAIELSKLEKDPSVTGTINLTTNPVDWSQLKSVPAGFSDGIDDVGTIGASSIGSFHIIDSTVSLADMAPNSVDSSKVVDASLVNADISPTAAIALAKLEKDPSVSGTINLATNPVDWSRLKSVPVGFSDGVDDVGTVGASSIGSFHIIDSTISLVDMAPNSVDSSKVVDSSLVNADISPTAGIELSKLEKDPSVAGVINVSTNPVDWTQLKSVPVGFADGIDDVGTVGASSIGSFHIIDGTITINDLAANSVGAFHIIDSTISLVDLAPNSVDFTKVVDGSLWNAEIAPTAAIELSKLEKDPSVSGTINLTTNPVDWSQLKSVPTGFSDGIDDIGTVGTSSIGSFHIIDSTVSLVDMAPNSVDSSKVVDGTLVNADISTGAAITLAKLEKDPSVSGTINLATNPVDWSRLKSVPVGFSDGIDDIGTVGADSIGSFHIIDSTVSLNDMAPNSVDSSKVVDGTLVNADISTGAAIALAKLEKDPSIPGTVNVATNPVDWSKLKNVPVGFSDGIDDIGTVGASSIGSFHIIDSTISLADMAPNSVGTSQIINGTITVNDLAIGSVGSFSVIDSTISLADMAPNSVDSSKVVDGSIVLADVSTTSFDTRYVTLSTTQTITASKNMAGVQASSLTVTGNFSTASTAFTAVNAANDNINVGNTSFVRIVGPTANFQVTGITGGYDGRTLVIFNTTDNNMILNNESASSIASNRILTLGGNNFSTTGEGSMTLIYSGADSRWIIIGRQL